MFNLKDKLNNFLDELEGVEETEVENEEEGTVSPISDDVKPASIPVTPVEIEPLTIPTTSVNTNTIKPVTLVNAFEVSRGSVITDDVVITGDIVTSAPLQFNGTIKGNIKSSEQVLIHGNVEGNIEGNSAKITASNIIGSIKCDGNVVITDHSEIHGDIYNNSISVDGIINGSIYSKERVRINENAEIYGNVTAASIAIEEGAVVNGNVKINGGRK
ncbi:MAG: polymer-forming cytoskeletal protein [Erysipelotrichaceae bacterium]|nr:polymer-forming cytoskeletal protein [Erysipelotrichaceae bacterium]